MVNKEQLLYFFLKGKISLSGYDMRFMSNLQNMIHRDKMVTSNQAKLFDALIYKYKRQLGKNGLNGDELKELPWRSTVVESTPEFTGARVDCIDGMLNLRVPFNKNFIAEFKNLTNPFTWYKEEKIYKAKFSTRALKLLYDQLPKFFKSVIYSPELHSLIAEIEKYKNLVWEPTVVKVGDNYIIAGANEHLLEAVNHIELNDLDTDNDIKTAFQLSRYQIKINPSILKNRKDLSFASSYYAEVDIEDIELVAKWLNTMNITNAVTTDSTLDIKKMRQSHSDFHDLVYHDVINAFVNYDIEIKSIDKLESKPDTTVFISFMTANRNADRYYFLDRYISKIIKIKNSRPVNIS